MKRLLILTMLLTSFIVGCDDFVTPADGETTLTLNIVWCNEDSTEPECLDQEENLTYAHDEY